VQLDIAAELVAADHVEELLQPRALASEQQLVAQVEHPQVPEHLPLVGEQRGVAAVARLERLDVVRDLPVEEGLGVRPGQREAPAAGTVDHAAALEQRLVLGGGRVGDGAHHCVSS
jgi:hypothetical protein